VHINRVLLLGTLASDPAVSFAAGGSQQVTFTIMVTKHGQADHVFRTFIPCQAYGRSAEKIGDLQKGDVVMVEGEISWRKATDDKPAGLAVFVQSVEVERVPALAVSAN
jgi:single-stranded DNA-binding protein